MTNRFNITEVADSVPFDNDSNGFTADDVQAAIEEVDAKITGKPRAVVSMGYKGTASSGRWLETFDGIPSNSSPFVVAEILKVRSISIAVKVNATTTFALYKNGVSVDTYSLSAQDTYTESGLNIDFLVDDEMSIQVTSGSCSEPVFFVNVEIQL